MANCKEWMAMDNRERILLVGQVAHLLMNDPDSFKAMSSMVRSADQRGLFEDVTILPDFVNTTP